MSDVLKYKNFIATVHYSSPDEVFHGKLEGINDLITFEGHTVQELKSAMKEAVEDYMEICRNIGKDPHRSYKGSFNVRINPELHRKAAYRSTERGLSLNQLVEEAIQHYLADNT